MCESEEVDVAIGRDERNQDQMAAADQDCSGLTIEAWTRLGARSWLNNFQVSRSLQRFNHENASATGLEVLFVYRVDRRLCGDMYVFDAAQSEDRWGLLVQPMSTLPWMWLPPAEEWRR